MNVDQHQTPITYIKAAPDQGGNVADKKLMRDLTPPPVGLANSTHTKKKSSKTLLMVLGLLVFVIGGLSVFLISQKQDTTPVAPNAPASQPAAYIQPIQTCTLEFEVPAVATSTPTLTPTLTPTPNPTTTLTPVPTVTVTPTPGLLACGVGGCLTTDDCEANLVCISTAQVDDNGKIVKYCSNQAYLDECVADPNESNCCSATPTLTPTPTGTRTPTPTVTPDATVTPIVIYATATPAPTYVYNYTTATDNETTTVITTAHCNESCNENADCQNISHICYEGVCRLDVNPTDSSCTLANGETNLVRPVSIPTQTGPADWMNYIKAGLGTLGVGALLLLLL